MAEEPFDPSLYTRAPILSISTAIALARALVDACPKTMAQSVQKAKNQLNAAVKAAQKAWGGRQKADAGGEDPRELDQEADTSWSAFRMRLQGYAALPVKRFPRAARAAELTTTLFGGGLDFLKDDYPSQWSAMDTLLKRIDDEKLAKDIDELVGPEFLKQVRNVTKRYGVMVEEAFGRDGGENLLTHVRAIQRAIVVYATKVCATVEDDEPKTAEIARATLRPIDNFRDQAAKRSGGRGDGGDEVGGDAGTPPAAPGTGMPPGG